MTLVSSLDVLGRTADVLLLSLLALALLRGSVTGAAAGFAGGLLVDVMTLDTLGVTALLYALAGYWVGPCGETTGRDRAHAPLLAVLVMTVAVAVAGFGLHFLLGRTWRGARSSRRCCPASDSTSCSVRPSTRRAAASRAGGAAACGECGSG